MKIFTISAVAALISTSAVAQEVTFFGEAEYAVEADAFEVGVGADIVVDRWTITPAVYADYIADEGDFNRAEITVDYQVNDNWNAYITVETDRDFEYAETTIGTRLEF